VTLPAAALAIRSMILPGPLQQLRDYIKDAPELRTFGFLGSEPLD
jgi:hypothetical protein